MESYTRKYDKLRIKLEYILLATNYFGSDKLIAEGGFGPVYKGELPHPMGGGTITVAIKRLSRHSQQGNTEFWQEIKMLHDYPHQNMVSLLYFCDERGERILVYEFVSGGSLDRHLNSNNLTWDKRLRVCFGVAKAIQHLHDPRENYSRVIHRDIKSGNILVDDETWFAKLSDFGLSRMAPANQGQSVVFTNAVGTLGYTCPEYGKKGYLVKGADVYSFGVVMYELICGRKCYDHRDGLVHVPMWKQCTDENRVDAIVFPGLKKHIGSASFRTFSSIASRCVNKNPKERPTMSQIVQWLDNALQQHNMDRCRINVQIPQDLINYVKRTLPNYSNKSPEEVSALISSGLLLDFGVTWLSTTKRGGLGVMISAVLCIHAGLHKRSSQSFSSRFTHVMAGNLDTGFALVGSTNYLKPGVTYNVNLVFKHNKMDAFKHIPFHYRVNQTSVMDSTGTQLREDGWLMTRLGQFTSQAQFCPFRVDFAPINAGPSNAMLRFCCEGIEFQPVEP